MGYLGGRGMVGDGPKPGKMVARSFRGGFKGSGFRA